MSSNFLDTSGFMFGTDVHLYFADAEGVPVPVPVPYVVVWQHFFGSRWREVSSVTTVGWRVLQENWQMLAIPHLPLPIPPPHPLAEPLEIVVIQLTSSSAPVLSAHSVTNKGFQLLTAFEGPVGTNANCGWVSVNFDFNFNSVITTPTAGDYAAALVALALNQIYNSAQEFFLRSNGVAAIVMVVQLFADIADRLDNNLRWLDPITQGINNFTQTVQQWADHTPPKKEGDDDDD